MTEIVVRKYRPCDMLSILRETEPETDHATWERHVRMAETPAEYSVAFSFFAAHELVLIAGLTIFNDFCGEVWMMKSLRWERYKYSLVHWTPKVLDWFQDNHKLKRLQADVVADDFVALHFLEHFGFKPEGRMECFDSLGRDCIRLSRIRK